VRFFLSRIASFAATASVLLVTVFCLGRLTGDPITTSLGDRLTDEELQRRISAAGYDQPLLVQFWNYFSKLLQGNFGTSSVSGGDVSERIFSHLPATLELGLISLILSLLISVPLAVISSKKPGGFLDSTIRSGAVAIYALPVFLTSMLLRVVFSIWIPIFPTSGRVGIEYQVELTTKSDLTGWYLIDSLLLGNVSMLLSVLAHLVLPGLAIAILIAANLTRVIRSNLVFAFQTEALEFANSLGLSRRSLLWPHAAKIIAPQVLTSFGYSIASIVGGFVYAEVSFEWRGLGSLLTESVLKRDFEVIQGIVILLVLIIVAVNALVDLTIQLIDRRHRGGSDNGC
jgi:peptide/nickel transport system permease protein